MYPHTFPHRSESLREARLLLDTETPRPSPEPIPRKPEKIGNVQDSADARVTQAKEAQEQVDKILEEAQKVWPNLDQSQKAPFILNLNKKIAPLIPMKHVVEKGGKLALEDVPSVAPDVARRKAERPDPVARAKSVLTPGGEVSVHGQDAYNDILSANSRDWNGSKQRAVESLPTHLAKIQERVNEDCAQMLEGIPPEQHSSLRTQYVTRLNDTLQAFFLLAEIASDGKIIVKQDPEAPVRGTEKHKRVFHTIENVLFKDAQFAAYRDFARGYKMVLNDEMRSDPRVMKLVGGKDIYDPRVIDSPQYREFMALILRTMGEAATRVVQAEAAQYYPGDDAKQLRYIADVRKILGTWGLMSNVESGRVLVATETGRDITFRVFNKLEPGQRYYNPNEAIMPAKGPAIGQLSKEEIARMTPVQKTPDAPAKAAPAAKKPADAATKDREKPLEPRERTKVEGTVAKITKVLQDLKNRLPTAPRSQTLSKNVSAEQLPIPPRVLEQMNAEATKIVQMDAKAFRLDGAKLQEYVANVTRFLQGKLVSSAAPFLEKAAGMLVAMNYGATIAFRYTDDVARRAEQFAPPVPSAPGTVPPVPPPSPGQQFVPPGPARVPMNAPPGAVPAGVYPYPEGGAVPPAMPGTLPSYPGAIPAVSPGMRGINQMPVAPAVPRGRQEWVNRFPVMPGNFYGRSPIPQPPPVFNRWNAPGRPIGFARPPRWFGRVQPPPPNFPRTLYGRPLILPYDPRNPSQQKHFERPRILDGRQPAYPQPGMEGIPGAYPLHPGMAPHPLAHPQFLPYQYPSAPQPWQRPGVLSPGFGVPPGMSYGGPGGRMAGPGAAPMAVPGAPRYQPRAIPPYGQSAGVMPARGPLPMPPGPGVPGRVEQSVVSPARIPEQSPAQPSRSIPARAETAPARPAPVPAKQPAETVEKKEAPVSAMQQLWKDYAEAKKAGKQDVVKELEGKINAERLKEMRKPGREVYVLIEKSNGQRVMERGVVTSGKQGLVVRNDREKWEIPLDPANCWLPEELEQGQVWALQEVVPRKPEAEFIRRKHEFLEKHATLSKADYQRLFLGRPLGGNLPQGEMSQGIGNCYLIALFKSLQLSDHGEALLRTSVRISGNGYEVRIPIGDASAEWRPITRGDLQPQQSGEMETVNIVDERGRLIRQEQRPGVYEPVDASEGWQVLEAAYIRYVDSKSKNRTVTDAKGRQTLDRKASERGNSDRAAVGLIAGIDKQNTDMFNEESKERMRAWLDNFSNGKDIGVAGRIGKVGDTEVAGTKIQSGHAYTIHSVDAARQRVTVLDPNNTSRPITLSYEDFLKTFQFVHGGTVNYEKMFRS